MIQVASFLLPQEQDQANEFLKTHRPMDGGLHFNKDTIIIFYDDGTKPVEYQTAELRDLINAVDAATRQQEIALYVMQSERDRLNATHNKGQYEELSHKIMETKKNMDLQASKKAFLQGKIDELSGQK
jgi:hypothetical protein